MRDMLVLTTCHRRLKTYFGFARVALMTGDANLIEQAMQLADDGRDLLGEIASVHDGF